MKFSEILAILLIAILLFMVVLIFTSIYFYVREGDMQLVQIALAIVLALVSVFLAAFRRQVKKAERIAARHEITD